MHELAFVTSAVPSHHFRARYRKLWVGNESFSLILAGLPSPGAFLGTYARLDFSV